MVKKSHMGYIDTHSHIYSEEFNSDRDEAVKRALDVRVDRIILPDIDSLSRPAMLNACLTYPDIMFPLIGLHPTSVKPDYKKELSLIEHHLGTGQFYGIGECGIDLYWDRTYIKEQVKAFEHLIHLAKEMDFPLIVHSRDALSETLSILKKHPYVRGILHCFPGNPEEALLAKELGFFLGIGGVVTFKNTHLTEVIQKTGMDNIVLETDTPYLAPVPYRGKRNESSYIPIIAGKIAEIMQVSIEKMEAITTGNAMNLFKFVK